MLGLPHPFLQHLKPSNFGYFGCFTMLLYDCSPQRVGQIQPFYHSQLQKYIVELNKTSKFEAVSETWRKINVSLVLSCHLKICGIIDSNIK